MKTKNRLALAALCGAVLFSGRISAEPEVDPNTIYGPDDRLDLYRVEDPHLLRLADSTVALFKAGQVTPDPAGGPTKLMTVPYSLERNLCPEEPFYDQKIGAFCSGFLVGPDLLMTAGHCVTSAFDCSNVRFVFGFGIRRAGEFPDAVPAGEVYGCKELLGREEPPDLGPDWAVVRLDRPVTGHAPLNLNLGDAPKNGTPIFVIGHPAGLPTKIAGGERTKVRDASPNGYFVANLDTYGGNSGSAVFNAVTGLVEGILVRGEQDYEERGSCTVSKRCPDDGCRGEDVTKISAVLPHVPPSTAKTPAVAAIWNPRSESFSSLLRTADTGAWER